MSKGTIWSSFFFGGLIQSDRGQRCAEKYGPYFIDHERAIYKYELVTRNKWKSVRCREQRRLNGTASEKVRRVLFSSLGGKKCWVNKPNPSSRPHHHQPFLLLPTSSARAVEPRSGPPAAPCWTDRDGPSSKPVAVLAIPPTIGGRSLSPVSLGGGRPAGHHSQSIAN